MFNTRSMGVAHTPCILPTTGKPSFRLEKRKWKSEWDIMASQGLKTKMMSADEVTELLTRQVLEDLPFQRGDEVTVLVNGLGSTSL